MATSATAALLAFVAVTLGAGSLGSVFILGSAALAFYARHWLVLAGRSRVGAGSEEEVRRELAGLRSEGWRMRQSLSWRGRGDIRFEGDRAGRHRVRGRDEDQQV
ncbi:MAG: hypothetical protein JO240_04855 [Solirubrobacterales bacterium]|nr:hypothetical protein [Solirubrobacterales bacterium]